MIPQVFNLELMDGDERFFCQVPLVISSAPPWAPAERQTEFKTDISSRKWNKSGVYSCRRRKALEHTHTHLSMTRVITGTFHSDITKAHFSNNSPKAHFMSITNHSHCIIETTYSLRLYLNLNSMKSSTGDEEPPTQSPTS